MLDSESKEAEVVPPGVGMMKLVEVKSLRERMRRHRHKKSIQISTYIWYVLQENRDCLPINPPRGTSILVALVGRHQVPFRAEALDMARSYRQFV